MTSEQALGRLGPVFLPPAFKFHGRSSVPDLVNWPLSGHCGPDPMGLAAHTCLAQELAG